MDFRDRVREKLLAERNAAGIWEGELSSSALSTATALMALRLSDDRRDHARIEAATSWLLGEQNDDGGWGDTSKSFSNISTTLLVWSALTLAKYQGEAMNQAENWIRSEAGSLEPQDLARKVTARYGKDRTFSVPILMSCALAGRLGARRRAWALVYPLPLELAAFPRSWFAALNLPVVSYALPALIAIGHARNVHRPPWLWGLVRRAVWPRVSKLLESIQPASGGFLEAAPLTSFVVMALASAGEKTHPVVVQGVRFLRESMRSDGSWPIDTNLSTWVTTLAVKAVHRNLSAAEKRTVRDWLLAQQYGEVHPFTGAAPGGWAWTPLPGGVPDADDTPGALLALRALDPHDSRVKKAAAAGCQWLLDLQNRDGGMPTFCRGWGALPFDRSSPDLTAHAIRAWNEWRNELPEVERGIERGLKYLERCQREDGAWEPLWFGNQHVVGESNAVYGTSMVVLALPAGNMRARGVAWLLAVRNEDGGWGGDGVVEVSSIEETALALTALAQVNAENLAEELRAGEECLRCLTGDGKEFPAAPIGFYFAKLWYFEGLYPLVWTAGALESLELRGIDSFDFPIQKID